MLRLVDECLPTQPLWHALWMLAADASKVRLVLLGREGNRGVREAALFGLFRPGIELFDSLILYCLLVGGRQMLFERLGRLGCQDMLVLERGYPGAWLVSALLQCDVPFCMRCDSSSAFTAVTRFMRSGKERVLMKSLLDATEYPAGAFADLYHRRWRIEEAFKRLKHRLCLEHTSGLAWLAACQDVGAKMVCDNLNALAVYLATDHFIAPDSPWRINRTLAFSHIRRLLPRVLAGRLRPCTRLVADLFSEIVLNLHKFIPNRNRPRPIRPKLHKSHVYKFVP